MLWQVDPSSEIPLYEQVAGTVRRALGTGELTTGTRLPSAKELAASLDVNLHTVLRAYQLLRDEGLIDLRRGRGAVVVGTDPGGRARLHDMINDLLAEGRRQGLTSVELAELVRERT